MAAVSVDQFVAALRASRLLAPREFDAALAAITSDDRRAAPALAAALIRQGALTKFQARKLLTGVSRGMVVGPYRILAPLGKGGMGKVYLARDSRNGRPVALKVLPPHWARDEERMLLRFQREMEITGTLDHPNLARGYDAGVAGDVHFIALEYVPGTTLSKRVNRGGTLPPDIAARFFGEAADGLAHAHERGLIHRDIKPSNLMMTPAGHAKVLDLGLALRPGEAGEPTVIGGKGYVVGTMDYVAPEQTRNAAGVDARADLYALGATMFFALTGRPPFPGGTSKEKIMRQRNEEPPRADEYNGDVPEDLAELLLQLMAKEPDDRPRSARKVSERLKAWAAPPAPPDAPLDPARVLTALAEEPDTEADTTALSRLPSRDWAMTLLIGASVLLALTLAALLFVLVRR